MTEQELRALVRQAIALHARHGHAVGAVTPVPAPARIPSHISHARFALPSEPEGSCVIEPAVGCNHCGFCKSYGH